MPRFMALAPVLITLAAAGVSGCGTAVRSTGHGGIRAVGAENEYANVISQIGGRYVTVSAIMDNPNTDPHTFEASPSVAAVISSAQLVVQNGIGYDNFMERIESASPNAKRQVINVQHLLGVPDSEPNPHLWYNPRTMPAVAAAVARALGHVDPRRQAFFDANVRRFDASLTPWYRALSDFRRAHSGTGVATTEPVADYMLQAAGTRILTPLSLQLDIMNGVDPAPQNVTTQDTLLSHHRAKVFLYNRQVTDSVTESFLRLADADHVPVVGVYETMPPGYDYQQWMMAETRALAAAVSHGRSTRTL